MTQQTKTKMISGLIALLAFCAWVHVLSLMAMQAVNQYQHAEWFGFSVTLMSFLVILSMLRKLIFDLILQ